MKVSPELLRLAGNIAATVLTSLATTQAFPALTPVFAALAGILVGWVNGNKPGTAAKIEAARNEEPPK